MAHEPQIIQHRDNLVRCFVDTEFYEDGNTIDLISIGAVRSDGAEFYMVNSDAKLHLVSPWVRENVVRQLPPYSSDQWAPQERIASNFSHFLGKQFSPGKDECAYEIWGYDSDYDWVAICQMYGTMMRLPSHFPRFCLDLKQLSRMLGNPKHPEQTNGENNALADARWNKELYEFLRGVESK